MGALLLAFSAIGMFGAAQATAGVDFYINVHNNSPYPTKLLGGDNDCWYIDDLAGNAAPAVPSGQSRLIHTESKDSGSCFESSKSQNLEIVFQRNGTFADAYHGATTTADAMSYNIDDRGSWDLWQPDEGTNGMRARPRGWLPFNINRTGAQDNDIRGMYCLKAHKSDHASYDLDVNSGADCINSNGPRTSHLPAPSVSKSGAAKVGPVKSSGNSDLIYNLFQTAQFACETTRPTQYWGYEACDYANNGDVWNMDNLTTDVKTVKADGDAQVVGGWTKIASQTFTNKSGGEGEQSWEYKMTQGEETENETHRGYKVGGKVSFEKSWSLPVFGKTKIGFDVEVEGEWGSTDTTKKSTEKEVTQGAKVTVPEGKTVRMVVKQQQSTLATNFTADLAAGRNGIAQPIKTPAARPLGINPSRNHPCIGYLGAGSPNSIRKLSDYAYAQGMTPEDPNLSLNKKYFLTAGPSFSADSSAAARCPGFPDGFPAAFAFKGTASYKANAGGPTPSKAKFAPDLPDLQVCAYDAGGDHPHALQAGDDDPCAVGRTPSAAEYGALINGADVAAHEAVRSDPDGAYLQAGGSNRLPGGELRAYQGLLGDDVLSGTEAEDLLLGGSGEDIIEGLGGDDHLFGEEDDDVIEGGAGNDELSDPAGRNWLQGGDGNDRLSSDDGATGGLYGDKGEDTLTMLGRGGVTLLGGAGDDAYRLENGARGAGVVEMSREGFDVVHTDGDAKLTAYVERIVAVGNEGLALYGNAGDNWMLGGPGGDTVMGGQGSDLLKGKGGADRLVLQPYGLDLAVGGGGADRFEVRGTGPLGTITTRRKRAGARSSHLIQDLRVKQGDRIVLHRKDFNRGLRKARQTRITPGQKARGERPQFLFARRSHLLSYDSDGTGPRPSVVIARIAKAKRVPLSAIQIK